MRVGPKGQVVIPKVIRESLGIVPGEKVVFELESGRVVIERPKVDVVKIFEEIARGGRSIKKFDLDKNYEEMMGEKWRKVRMALRSKNKKKVSKM